MQEIILEKNPLALKIYINGKPDLCQIEKAEKEDEIAHLQIRIAELFKKKRTKSKDSASSSKNG